MRRCRVASCLASSTQQMNSLRARGVMSFQAASAVELAISASCRSAGSLCTTPPGSFALTRPRLATVYDPGVYCQTKPWFPFSIRSHLIMCPSASRMAAWRREHGWSWTPRRDAALVCSASGA
jgi:hypothetical protein